MALLLKKLFQSFYNLDELSDPRVEHLPLMSSSLYPISIVCVYFMFVYYWGPSFMAKREPFNIKKILVLFNLSQIILNVFLLIEACRVFYNYNWRCQPVNYSSSAMYEVYLTYIYHLVKVSDLLDTVFFILRKNHRQVTFLHVYHHIGMLLTTWMGVKFLAGGYSLLVGIANCMVHIVMYTYYLLSAWNEEYKKSLWWKKYITQMQLIQFCFLLFAYGRLLIVDCNYPKGISYFLVIQNVNMLVLFGDFYYRTYIKKKDK